MPVFDESDWDKTDSASVPIAFDNKRAGDGTAASGKLLSNLHKNKTRTSSFSEAEMFLKKP